MSYVYVIHIDPPYPRDKRGSVRHYVGWCADSAKDRLERHTSPLVRAAKAAGCELTIGYEAAGGRTDERNLKRQRHAERVCEICKATI